MEAPAGTILPPAASVPPPALTILPPAPPIGAPAGYFIIFNFCPFCLFLRQMLPDDTRSKIKNITAGAIIEGSQDHCTATRNLLCASFPTSTTVKKDFESKALIKEKQAKLLEQYSSEKNLWVTDLPGQDRYLTRGGEALVYLSSDNKSVIKLNDGIYYATWLEFLNSILLHNLIFENTAYTLLGFAKENNVLYAVLKQPFITSDSPVDLEDVKKLLHFNDFENSKRNDYIHRELGLLLEDMHDENVIASSDTLFFIDTVFYTVTPGNS
ncbi:MAG: hypothetical protein WDN26_07135 [Chitinophagaceae bacterium]